MTLPEAPEPFRAPSWAWYEVASAADAMPGMAMTAMPTAMDGAASNTDFFMLSSWNGVAGDPAWGELEHCSWSLRRHASHRMGRASRDFRQEAGPAAGS